MVDVRERRSDRLPVRSLQAIGEDDGVLRLFLHRQERAHDERVGLALVPGEEIVDAVDLPRQEGAERVRVIDDPVEVEVEAGGVGGLRDAGGFLD